MLGSYQIGKVRVERIAPNIYKLVCSPWVWWTGVHFERAIAELSKQHKVISVDMLHSFQNYKLVFVE